MNRLLQSNLVQVLIVNGLRYLLIFSNNRTSSVAVWFCQAYANLWVVKRIQVVQKQGENLRLS